MEGRARGRCLIEPDSGEMPARLVEGGREGGLAAGRWRDAPAWTVFTAGGQVLDKFRRHATHMDFDFQPKVWRTGREGGREGGELNS